MNWIDYIPLDNDVQVSRSQDYEACGSYSFIHILEMILRKETGFFYEFSERFMAKVSDTQPWGNSLQGIVNAANQYGACLASDWPPLTYSDKYEDIDWATYYAPIPNSVFKRCYVLKVGLLKLQPSQVASALEKSPLWTIIKTSGGSLHIVAQLNKTQYYDSYEVRVKNFQPNEPIQSQYQLTINIYSMPNSYLIQVNKKDGTKEIALALPAVDGGALIDKGLNMGLPIPTTNNDGKNVDWPNLPIKYIVNEQ